MSESKSSEHQKLWNEHAMAVGKIAMAWNSLQETLAEVFADIFTRSEWKLAIAAWHSLTSDVAQQEMLRAVAKEKFGPDSRSYSEISWLLEKLKQHSSHQRNFGVHTPFMILHKLDQSVHVLPHTHTGNRKAAALATSGKDVLKEFAEYEQEIRKLVSFAMGIKYNISPVRSGPESWPERPQLRSRAPSLTPKA
jgi:hypothetical protein